MRVSFGVESSIWSSSTCLRNVGATRTVEIVDECRRRLNAQSGTLL
jgi:hypothetical protein